MSRRIAVLRSIVCSIGLVAALVLAIGSVAHAQAVVYKNTGPWFGKLIRFSPAYVNNKIIGDVVSTEGAGPIESFSFFVVGPLNGPMFSAVYEFCIYDAEEWVIFDAYPPDPPIVCFQYSVDYIANLGPGGLTANHPVLKIDIPWDAAPVVIDSTELLITRKVVSYTENPAMLAAFPNRSVSYPSPTIGSSTPGCFFDNPDETQFGTIPGLAACNLGYELALTVQPEIGISVGLLPIEMEVGGSASGGFVIFNTAPDGSLDLAWSIVEDLNCDGGFVDCPWLVAPTAGSTLAGDNTTVFVDVSDPSALLQPGTHTCTLEIQSNALANPTFPVLVSLLVDPNAVDWAHVFDPGNVCDFQAQGCFGAVANSYRISKLEVTNKQYTQFLNAVAAADPNGLYNTSMASGIGDITRFGSPGSYLYSATPGFRADWPVRYVSFWDAARYVNWLQNDRPTGAQDSTTTEDGTYTITPAGIASNSITRNPGAQVYLPSEDEWHKAAYYDTDAMVYYEYPAGSDTAMVCFAAGATPDTANCGSQAGNTTEVGSYTGSVSPNGTFDQGGNVIEWNEDPSNGTLRAARGGGHLTSPVSLLSASERSAFAPTLESSDLGFRVASHFPYLGVAINVDVQGDYAYIGDEGGFGLGDARLRIFDVSNPADPLEVGSINTIGTPRAVMAVGDVVYVAAETAGLRVIDVSTPSAPVEIGFLEPPGRNSNGIDVVGDVAYLADGFNGLNIIVVSNPALPFSVGLFDTPLFAIDVVVRDNIAYVADQSAGLMVIDVSNPFSPVLLATLPGTGLPLHLDLFGDFVYLAQDSGGVRKIDISNPAAPFEVSVFAAAGARSVDAVDTPQGVAVVAVLASGEVKVIDFSNPLAPSEFSSATLPGFAGDGRVEGGFVYVAAGLEGLVVFEAEPIPAPRVIDFEGVAVPNGQLSTQSYSELGFDISSDVDFSIVGTAPPDSASLTFAGSQPVLNSVELSHSSTLGFSIDGFEFSQFSPAPTGPLLVVTGTFPSGYSVQETIVTGTEQSQFVQFPSSWAGLESVTFESDALLTTLDNIEVVLVPEPAANLMLLAGAGLLILLSSRRTSSSYLARSRARD